MLQSTIFCSYAPGAGKTTHMLKQALQMEKASHTISFDFIYGDGRPLPRSIKKDRSENPPKYVVFFKGRDADVIARAFKDYCDLNEKRSRRPSVREKLNKFKAISTMGLDKEKVREKKLDKDKEASL